MFSDGPRSNPIDRLCPAIPIVGERHKKRPSVACFAAVVLIGLVVPFTFVVVLPAKRRLLDQGRHGVSAETRAPLEKWNKLHAVRTALSLVASLIYLWLLRQA